MHWLSILLVALIGGTVIVGVALIPLSSSGVTGLRRWLAVTASCLLAVGATGFFGSALSAVGGLNWLPASFEWPVGYVGGAVTTPQNLHVVPHTPSGRIQVYDADWTFRTGWHVDAGAGTFKLLSPSDGQIEVITARGERRIVFDLDGRLIAENTYRPKHYEDFPDPGESAVVPTAPWLWVFAHPAVSWGVAAAGMAILIFTQKPARRKRAGGLRNGESDAAR
mgnify:CR=1 FL=1